MSYGTTCPCPDEAYAQSFMTVLDYECPFRSSADIDFNRATGYDYLFDTTFELNYKGGNAFVYYGMTEDERFSSGVQAEGSNFGRYWRYEPNLPDVHLNVK